MSKKNIKKEDEKKEIIIKFKKSRAFRGASTGDISNSVIRYVLSSISEALYGKFKNEYIRETLEFFDWKCPYTGKSINVNTYKSFQVDHIIPQNQKECGLNIRGNLIYCDKEANQLKNDLSAEDFLLVKNIKNEDKKKKLEEFWKGTSESERENRLNKIKEWQKECGYNPDTIKRKVQKMIQQMYKEVTDEQISRMEQMVQKLGETPVIVFHPADKKLFKEKLIEQKFAEIVLYDKDGKKVKTYPWDASKFTENSDLMHNITTKDFWKNRKSNEFIRVEVTVKENHDVKRAYDRLYEKTL